MFCCFVVGDPRTQWDKIVHVTHTKDPWIGVNGSSNKKQVPLHSFLAVLFGLHQLHKLTIFPVDAAEK